MKKRLTFILIVCAIVCLSTSCARKINGATPHRRDRNCGCENLSPTLSACDSYDVAMSQCTGETEIPSPPIVGERLVTIEK